MSVAPGSFEAELALLIERVSDRNADPAQIDAATARCARAFERLCAATAGGTPFAGAAVRRYLALLQELSARELADTERRLQLARTARRALALQCESERAASACDCAG